MNWGYKITFLYLGFVALIATLIVLSMRQRVDLVADDYYEQELQYQNRIDAINRTSALKESLTWQVDSTVLHLQFPKDLRGRSVSGSIFFFRPSDARLDRTEEIGSMASDNCSVPLDGLHSGMYRMQITWKAGTEQYYNEGVIQIP
jgi:hypothetical protein